MNGFLVPNRPMPDDVVLHIDRQHICVQTVGGEPAVLGDTADLLISCLLRNYVNLMAAQRLQPCAHLSTVSTGAAMG